MLPNQPASVQPHVLVDPDFRQGFAYLRTYGLVFEAWLYHPQIAGADRPRARLPRHARSSSTTSAVRSASARTPGGATRSSPAGKQDIAELARCPNVVAKVGGIQMVVNGFGWHERESPPTSDELLAANRDWYLHTHRAVRPGSLHVREQLPGRPAVVLYTVLWNQFKKLTKDFAPAERAAMFHDTARRVYRLPQV